MDGLPRAADAFAALGDFTVAEQAMTIVEALATRTHDGTVLARLEALKRRNERRVGDFTDIETF